MERAFQSGKNSLGADLSDLVACPVCDTLHRFSAIPQGGRGTCKRCHHILATPRPNAMTRIVMLAITATILMMAAISFPFLTIETHGLRQQASVIDTILAYSEGLMVPLSLAMAALIVVLPLTRLTAILYTVAPMALGHHPVRGAARAFRIAEHLKPWAMAEVFIVGVAVALVKVGGLATLTIGPAFWAFAALVLITILQDNFMSSLIIWKTLETRGTT
ncbi:paraquat-inducible protein A (plasmid) [Pseudorhodobacter turbinis]|uniref:Paraquat-inducible protein A n=1 Tax=Pseudorhodobacter turbinis TaxID=2500533 RepID=A0A4P8EJJ4_9RHOB|nr:paraquat-inducible protein A [Pseudorhodobacter turbinis]QCO57206.1 paraquat-inducible protein A [Pseudorhodobacter turbinis]